MARQGKSLRLWVPEDVLWSVLAEAERRGCTVTELAITALRQACGGTPQVDMEVREVMGGGTPAIQPGRRAKAELEALVVTHLDAVGVAGGKVSVVTGTPASDASWSVADILVDRSRLETLSPQARAQMMRQVQEWYRNHPEAEAQ